MENESSLQSAGKENHPRKNMAAPAGITESLTAKIAPYNNIACTITNERTVDMKAFYKNILKKERWVDIRKFVSKG